MSVITDPVANTDGWWAGERRVFWCLEPFKELRNWAVGLRSGREKGLARAARLVDQDVHDGKFTYCSHVNLC